MLIFRVLFLAEDLPGNTEMYLKPYTIVHLSMRKVDAAMKAVKR